MNNQTYQYPLARTHRSVFFYGLLLLFIIIVPLLVLYANGYRYNPWAEEPAIVITGGFYIATQIDDSQIYVNERLAENSRFFRRATYVQNLTPGIHRIHVQGEDLQTWVKDLPVYQQIVTEVAAFTIPERPQVRPVTPYLAADGEPVFLGYTAAEDLPFSFASSTISVTYTDTTATTGWIENPEYTFLATRFTDLERPQQNQPEQPRFRFATSSPVASATTSTTSSATSTKESNAIRLERRGDDVYARYAGQMRHIPYYYCVPVANASTTAAQYGDHVSQAIFGQLEQATTTLQERGTWLGQICRTEIALDRKGQAVQWFDFVPGYSDLILLHLDDGVYVTEIDDRAWQNHQLLYPGEVLEVLVEGGQIFIQDGEYFVEVFLELP